MGGLNTKTQTNNVQEAVILTPLSSSNYSGQNTDEQSVQQFSFTTSMPLSTWYIQQDVKRHTALREGRQTSPGSEKTHSKWA